MRILTEKRGLFIILAVVIIVLITVLHIMLTPTVPRGSNTPLPQPVAKQVNTSEKFSQLLIGRYGTVDVIKTLGQPDSITVGVNGRKDLLYASPLSGIFNKVVTINDKTIYSLEFLPQVDKQNSFSSIYGQYDMHAYDLSDEATNWYVYSTKGIAIKVQAETSDVLEVLRFLPQTKNEFESFFPAELGLSVSKPPAQADESF